MKRRIFAIFAIILQLMNASGLYSQSGLRIGNELQTPSTDSWNFIKYGEVGANLYTGTVNLSVPFYTYKDNDFEIPVSLDYASNGLVANTRAGTLGHGWNLNAGGCISVEINGIPDAGNNFQSIPGFYQLHKTANLRDVTKLNRYYNIAHADGGYGMPAPEILYFTSSGQKYDAEPDIYHFNVMGHSGTFHLGFNNQIYVYNTSRNNKGYKVEIVPFSGHYESITITAPDGYKFVFDCRQAEGMNTDVTDEPGVGARKRVLSWKLSEIIAPNGRTAQFEYIKYEINNFRPCTFCDSGTYMNTYGDGIPEKESVNSSETAIYESTIEAAFISKIRIDNIPVIQFTYENMPAGRRDTYIKNSSVREFDISPRLKKIEVLAGTELIKNCIMDYTFMSGSSYLSSANISGEGIYSMNYYGGSSCAIGTHGVDHWGYFNGKSSGGFFLKVATLKSNFEEELRTSVRNPSEQFAKYGMLQKITFPTQGYTTFEYATHDYSHAIKRTAAFGFDLQVVNESGVCGGMRIKKINSYCQDGSETPVLLNSKEYEYTNGSTSTGILLHMPRYYITYSAGCVFNLTEDNVNYWSSNLVSYNSTHIEYQNVTEKRSDGSKIRYSFSNSLSGAEYRDYISLSAMVPEYSQRSGEWVVTSNPAVHKIVAPATSRQGDRGKLITKEIFAAGENTPIYSENYTYHSDEVRIDYLPAYLIRKFAYRQVHVDNYKLVSNSQCEYIGDSYLNRDVLNMYNNYGQLSSTTLTNSKKDKEITRYTYATDHSGSGGIYSTMISKNMQDYPVSIETFYKPAGGPEVRTGGKKYNYSLIGNMVKLASESTYNSTRDVWNLETTYNSYDTKGNLTQSSDANGIPTSYIRGYNGLYLVAKGENISYAALSAQVGASSTLPAGITVPHATVAANCPDARIEFYEYKPLVGLSKHTNPSGKVLTYSYNLSGKLKAITDEKGKLHREYLYSPDNKQQ